MGDWFQQQSLLVRFSTLAGHSIPSPQLTDPLSSSPTPVGPPQPLAGLQSNWMAGMICINSNSLPIPTWMVSLNPDPFSNPLQSTGPQTAVLAQLQVWSTTKCQAFPQGDCREWVRPSHWDNSDHFSFLNSPSEIFQLVCCTWNAFQPKIISPKQIISRENFSSDGSHLRKLKTTELVLSNWKPQATSTTDTQSIIIQAYIFPFKLIYV